MEGNNVKSFENLCKIFEMRIKLDKEKKVKTPSDVLINYEKYAKKIDNIYNEDFEKEVRPLLKTAPTIEEERERLEKLINLLEERLAKRSDLENRFFLATGDYMTGLQVIVSDKELDDKKERLELINKYLDTANEISEVNDSISKLQILLDEEEKQKEEYKLKNQIMEDDLYSEFMKVIKEDNSYANITEDNVSEEIKNLKPIVKESKETLDITRDSVKSLITNGEEDDYSSYVEEAEKNYFIVKNREFVLKIYQFVINFEDDFNSIFNKRDEISEIIKQRKDLIHNLGITDLDVLLSFENKLLDQIKIVNKEKETLENISNYTSRIEFKETRLEKLEEDNNSVEILAILREFNLIDTYNNEDFGSTEALQEGSIPTPDVVEEVENDKLDDADDEEDNVINEFIDPYRIKEIIDLPPTLNLGLAKLKGESVREKVNKKLNPKQENIFNIEASHLDKPVEESSDFVSTSTEETSTLKEDSEAVPTWEIPSGTNNNLNINVIPEKNVFEDKAPVWQMPKEELNNNSNDTSPIKENNYVPLWEDIKPKLNNSNEEISNIDINISKDKEVTDITDATTDYINSNNSTNNINTTTNNNAFWIPVSDEKLETNVFPSINIPINNNLSSSNDFGFPDINNN